MFLYCNSPLIQGSALTADSLILTELFGCIINPNPK